MQIEVGSIRDNDPIELQAYIEVQLRPSVAGLGRQFESVEVRLFETGEARASVTCRIQLKLRPSGICVIQESHDPDAHTAIDRAMHGIARLSSVRQGISIVHGPASMPA